MRVGWSERDAELTYRSLIHAAVAHGSKGSFALIWICGLASDSRPKAEAVEVDDAGARVVGRWSLLVCGDGEGRWTLKRSRRCSFSAL